MTGPRIPDSAQTMFERADMTGTVTLPRSTASRPKGNVSAIVRPVVTLAPTRKTTDAGTPASSAGTAVNAARTAVAPATTGNVYEFRNYRAKTGGAVRHFKVLRQETRDDVVVVKINACVEPTRARDALSALALNSAVAVFIPARVPNTRENADAFEETNILSETLIGRLTDQGYSVVDVAPTGAADAAEIEKAAKGGSSVLLRSLMYRFLSNLIIIGKLDYNISVKKGEDIGYGIAMPFQNVTVRLTYRMVARNNKTGKMEILTAGVEQARGLANSVEDAAARAMEDMAEALTPKLLDKVAEYIQGNVKKVRIEVQGVKTLDANMEVQDLLQTLVWVTNVEEKGLGQFVVSYPENTLYLANSLKQKEGVDVVNFSPYSLTLKYAGAPSRPGRPPDEE